jgi:hypothetical protein
MQVFYPVVQKVLSGIVGSGILTLCFAVTYFWYRSRVARDGDISLKRTKELLLGFGCIVSLSTMLLFVIQYFNLRPVTITAQYLEWRGTKLPMTDIYSVELRVSGNLPMLPDVEPRGPKELVLTTHNKEEVIFREEDYAVDDMLALFKQNLDLK